ncbi:MAG: hypothetical protein JWP92_3792, partial [Caulobacter sp.]|nr:hypothetical protein [Caulobacter sp.]
MTDVGGRGAATHCRPPDRGTPPPVRSFGLDHLEDGPMATIEKPDAIALLKADHR